MDWVQSIILALVQGITEFLPISSSAHLILSSEILGWPDQGLAFDVAVHVGTLLAVLVYFRDEILTIVRAWFLQFGSTGTSEESRLGWFICAATIPAGLVGLFGNDFIEQHLRSELVIALSTLIFGVLLFWADRTASQKIRLKDITLKGVVIIGCAQALALIPGTSRSGITITAALLIGINRVDSARFSFLISIPIIVLSGLLMGVELITESLSIDWLLLTIGVLVSSLSAYLCIHYFLAFISKMSMTPFVIYRLILGFALLLYVFINA